MDKKNNFNKLYLLLPLLFDNINFTFQYNKESLNLLSKKRDKKLQDKLKYKNNKKESQKTLKNKNNQKKNFLYFMSGGGIFILVICHIVFNKNFNKKSFSLTNNQQLNNSLQNNLSQEEINKFLNQENLSQEEINKFFNQDKFKTSINSSLDPHIYLDDIFIFIKLTSQALKKNSIDSLLLDHYGFYEELFNIKYIHPTFLNIFYELYNNDNYIQFINYYIDNQQQQEYLLNYLKFSYFFRVNRNLTTGFENGITLLRVLSFCIKRNLPKIDEKQKELSINILKYYHFQDRGLQHFQLEDLNDLITNIEDRKQFIKEYNENYNNRYLFTNNKNKLRSKLLEINNNTITEKFDNGNNTNILNSDSNQQDIINTNLEREILIKNIIQEELSTKIENENIRQVQMKRIEETIRKRLEDKGIDDNLKKKIAHEINLYLIKIFEKKLENQIELKEIQEIYDSFDGNKSIQEQFQLLIMDFLSKKLKTVTTVKEINNLFQNPNNKYSIEIQEYLNNNNSIDTLINIDDNEKITKFLLFLNNWYMVFLNNKDNLILKNIKEIIEINYLNLCLKKLIQNKEYKFHLNYYLDDAINYFTQEQQTIILQWKFKFNINGHLIDNSLIKDYFDKNSEEFDFFLNNVFIENKRNNQIFERNLLTGIIIYIDKNLDNLDFSNETVKKMLFSCNNNYLKKILPKINQKLKLEEKKNFIEYYESLKYKFLQEKNYKKKLFIKDNNIVISE
jgi:hypothetical protein